MEQQKNIRAYVEKSRYKNLLSVSSAFSFLFDTNILYRVYKHSPMNTSSWGGIFTNPHCTCKSDVLVTKKQAQINIYIYIKRLENEI